MTETTTTTTTPPAPWYTGVEGVDAELTGHFQNRGWDKLAPPAVAVAAAKAHREAEKLIGVPATRLLRLPEDMANADGMKEVWSRLGKPADAKDYDLTTVKRGNAPLDEKTQDFLRSVAFSTNLSKDGALRLAQEFAKFNDGLDSSSAADRAAALATEKAELKKNWGANEAANNLVAAGAAKALGVSPEHLAALENVIGYAKVMEMFRTIGTKIGEDKFVTAPGGGSPGVMTRDGAVAKKAELMRDTAWTKRYLDGGREEVREMTALNTIISQAAA